MNALPSLIATVILAALAAWFAGGLLLRVGGGTLALSGLLVTAAGHARPTMALSTIVGAALWLAGHWMHAARNHYYRSPLARRLFLTILPARLDPTRGWGVPTAPRARR